MNTPATYLCDTCGTARDTRTTGFTRRLRCVACGVTTRHSRVGNEADDWRERKNLQESRDLGRLLDEIAYSRDLLHRLGLFIVEADPDDDMVTTRKSGASEIASARLNKRRQTVTLHAGLTLAGQARALRVAGEKMAYPDMDSWDLFARAEEIINHAAV
ncbi:hypothetical protein [Microlunatus sp. Y2014]|uniref:hypothetical protein n=1 Tax=Microlunatus sp. Y2014 TaxID=3418488 RepID=UPI003DA74E41